MLSWLVLRDDPYVGVSDKDGKFTIKNLPVGTWTFVAWQSKSGFVKDVNVGGNTAPETFTVSNNLWYAHDDPGDSAPKNLPVAEAGAVIGDQAP